MNRPSSRVRFTTIALLLVTATIGVGGALVRFARPDLDQGRPTEIPADTRPARDESPAAPPRAAEPGPDRSETGAAQAAVAYLAAPQRWLYLTDDEIEAAVRQIAAPDAADRLADDTVADIAAARGELSRSPGRVWWIVHPLAWRVADLDADAATVEVWTMTLLSAADVALPQTEWITATVELRWSGGAWLVEAVRDTAGPTPMTGPRDRPWEPEPFDDALDGFTRLDGEPVT